MTQTAALLAALAIGATAGAARAGEALQTDVDGQATRLVQKVWDAALRTCGRSAFESVGGRVVIELESPSFHLAPTALTEAAKQSGYQYQVTAIAAAPRWRWAHVGAGALHWSPWQEGADIDVRSDEFGIAREHTLTQDGVLQFDLVRKDGAWTANLPLSPLNSDIHAFDPTAAVPASPAPACSRLVARH